AVRRRVLSDVPLDPYPVTYRPELAEPLSDEAEIWSALVMALQDYVRKNNFRSVLLGFSGGIDSAVVAALAADALGSDAVYGVSMPSKYSSAHSRSDAAELARRLGCHFRVEPVENIVAAYVDQLQLEGVAEENIQARVRGMMLMALSNMEGHLVLATGNKTELAVGYSTIYGDAVGGFAPIKDVFKTQVWELARWRNAEAEKRGETPPIPPNSITKPPSAELRPGQLDTDSLPDYALLDELLENYVGGDRGFADLLAAGFDAETVDRVVRMVDRAEYKRRQYPPGPKITFKAFGRDRSLPLPNAWREVHCPLGRGVRRAPCRTRRMTLRRRPDGQPRLQRTSLRGVHGFSHGVSGHPSAAAMRGNAVAPSMDSGRMAACPARRAVSSMRCNNSHRTDQAATSSGNHGTSRGTGSGRFRSSMSAMIRSVRVATVSYSPMRSARVSQGSREKSSPASVIPSPTTRSSQARSVRLTCLMMPPTLRALTVGVTLICSSVNPYAARHNT